MTTVVGICWHKLIGGMLWHVTNKNTSRKGGEWKERRNDMYAACRSSRTSQISRQIASLVVKDLRLKDKDLVSKDEDKDE